MNHQIICALDTPNLNEAGETVRRLREHVLAFKVGHALVLQHGLDVVDRLRAAGAERIFLDLKFHDIPNSVALAVREAARRGVWMTTLHISGGSAMMSAAVEQASMFDESTRPLLIGVSVLTSLDQRALSSELGINRDIEDHMIDLSKLAMQCEMDGIVCSPHEVKRLREALGPRSVIVTPGIRASLGENHDQKRVGDAQTALSDGSSYLVLGRALTCSDNIVASLKSMGLTF